MKRILGLIVLSSSLLAQPATEQKVLSKIQEMVRQGQPLNFSQLYNHDRFTAEEKAFLGRLYEIFFQIPSFLVAEQKSTGEISTREEIAASFGISVPSVDLLLHVMQADPRVPPLFTREGKEIAALNPENIEAFVRSRGDQVKLTQWEGKTLPPFELTSLAGEPISHRDLTGKNTLLYFWFTGCPPCNRIGPILADLDRRYGSHNFQIIGFNADRVLELETSDAERQAYLDKQEVHFTNAHLDAATRQVFGQVNIYPTLFFVNQNGTIIRHFLNFQDRDTLEDVVKQMIAVD